MRITYLFILAFIISPAIATSSDFQITGAVVAGAVTDHAITESIASSGDVGFITGGDNWNYQNNARRVTTLGYTKAVTSTRANSRVQNIMTSLTNVTSEDAAITENGYYMEDNKVNIPEELCTGGQTTPDIISAEGQTIEGQYPSHQTVDVTHTMMSNYGGKYESKGALNDVNATLSINAEGEGGGVTMRYNVHDEAGFNQSGNDKNYDFSARGRIIGNDYKESGYSMAKDLVHTNHDRPFETLTNSTRMKTNTTADEEILNQTGLVDIVNLTNTTL